LTDNKRAVIKVKLKDILNENIDNTKLFKAISNANNIIDIGYMFIRAFLLYAIENDKVIQNPKINTDFIKMAFSIICCPETKHGRPFDASKTPYLSILKNYYETIFKPKTNVNTLSATNLSYILACSHDQLYTSIINNIKYHFDKHVWKYIRTAFINEYDAIRELKNSDKLKEYYSEITKIKNDLFNNTKTSDIKYHEWINLHRPLIMPITYTEKSFGLDVKRNTFNYLKCMYAINKYLQEKEVKSYQIFPLRTGSYLHHIKINTAALIDIFAGLPCMNKLTKADYLKHYKVKKLHNQLWNDVFVLKYNATDNKYTRKGFSFNYEIDTDGFAVSLNFINDNELPKKEKKECAFKRGRDKTNENKLNMSEADFRIFQQKKNDTKDEKIEAQKIAEKEKQATGKLEFSKLPKEEQDNIKTKLNNLSEFPYIEKLLADPEKRKLFLKDFLAGNLILCDPGKKSPLYLMASNNMIHRTSKKLTALITNKDKIFERKQKKGGTGTNNFGISYWEHHKIMNYTNKTRIKFLKRKKYAQLVETWKHDKSTPKFNSVDELLKQKSLKDIEKELSVHNAKSCKHDSFINYIIKKLEYNTKTIQQYDTTYLQKLNWFTYLNKNKHENDLLNHIQNEFGKRIKIIIGDWSGKGTVKFMSTPNISLKRKLAERFEVYLIDEYLTSKIHYKHQVRCNNLTIKVEKLPENKKSDTAPIKLKTLPKTIPKKFHKKVNSTATQPFNLKQLHSVLTYSLVDDMGCKKLEMGCITRDKNSVLNMETIVKALLLTGNRPAIFKRSSNRVNLKICKNSKVKLHDASGAITVSNDTNHNMLNQTKNSIKKSTNKKSNNVIKQKTLENNYSAHSQIPKTKSVIKKSVISNNGKRKKVNKSIN